MNKLYHKSMFIIFLLIISFTFPQKTLAAKKFIPKTTSGNTSFKKTTRGHIYSKVHYRPDKKGVLLSFSDFSNIESASYSFIYQTNGTSQGAGGVIRPENNPAAERELLFGTCSSGVCTYHQNISNASLLLTAKYINGNSSTKRYRIKTYF